MYLNTNTVFCILKIHKNILEISKALECIMQSGLLILIAHEAVLFHISLQQRFSIPVLSPPRSAYFAFLFVNTPDSDNNQLVRSALHAWTVFRLTCSLHRVHCSLLPEQGKSAEVYFISEHSFMDLRCTTSSCTDECDIIHLCKYIQF